MAGASWRIPAGSGSSTGGGDLEEHGTGERAAARRRRLTDLRSAEAFVEINKDKDDSEAAAAATQEEGDKGKGKGKGKSKNRKDKDKGKDQKYVNKTTTKAVLKTMQASRALASTVYETFLVRKDSPVIQAIMEAGRKYARACREKGPTHEFGPPHFHLFDAFMEAMGKQEEGMGDLAIQLKTFAAESAQSDQDEMHMRIRYFRLTKTYGDVLMRLQLAWGPMTGPPKQIVVAKALKRLGAVQKYGQEPAGHLENSLQEILEFLDE